MQSVYAYFLECFERAPADSTLRHLPLDSACGKQCQKVLDAADTLDTEIVFAFGGNAKERKELLTLVEKVIGCLWRG